MALDAMAAGNTAVVASTMPGTAQMAGSLLLVVGLIFGLAIVLRRLQNLRGTAKGSVVLHGGVQVGSRERVLLIESQGQRLLVGVAPGNVRTLHVFDAAESVGKLEIDDSLITTAPSNSFVERLRSVMTAQGGN